MAKFTHETDITGYNILTNEDLDASMKPPCS